MEWFVETAGEVEGYDCLDAVGLVFPAAVFGAGELGRQSYEDQRCGNGGEAKPQALVWRFAMRTAVQECEDRGSQFGLALIVVAGDVGAGSGGPLVDVLIERHGGVAEALSGCSVREVIDGLPQRNNGQLVVGKLVKLGEAGSHVFPVRCRV